MAHIAKGKAPHDFATVGIKVNKAQAERLIGRQLDWDFSQIVAKKGFIDIGNLILIASGMSYGAENYINKTTGRSGELNAKRRVGYDKVLPENRGFTRNIEPPGRRARVAEDRAQQTRERLGISDQEQRTVDHYSRRYRPSGSGNARITQRRARTLARLSEQQLAYFYTTTPVTRAAKRLVDSFRSR